MPLRGGSDGGDGFDRRLRDDYRPRGRQLLVFAGWILSIWTQLRTICTQLRADRSGGGQLLVFAAWIPSLWTQLRADRDRVAAPISHRRGHPAPATSAVSFDATSAVKLNNTSIGTAVRPNITNPYCFSSSDNAFAQPGALDFCSARTAVTLPSPRRGNGRGFATGSLSGWDKAGLR